MSKLQAQFTKYIKIALKNDSIDYFRAIKKVDNIKYTSLEEVDSINVSLSQNCDADTFSFSNTFDLDNIVNSKLYFAMKSLTKRQQEIISLYADKVKIVDIARQLNVSSGTIKSSISQIKNKIKKYMEEK